MSGARSAILDRVRRAQITGRFPLATAAHPAAAAAAVSVAHVPKAPGAAPDPAAMLQRFLAELAALGVDHHVETSEADVKARVTAIVGRRSVFSWDADRLPYEVGAALNVPSTGASPRDLQASAEIGVTGCDAAIAETGSLVLLSGPGKPRAASLLPPVHLAIVRRRDLRSSMGEFFNERATSIADAACCSFITGPSRTADIELTLTVGVHGPGKVIVVVGP
jgi:L-lactate dehydrogenase complex protein LldG